MPHVAVVTGCSPNHLDWHESYADYVAAKQRMLTGQTAGDIAVLNTLDDEAAGWSPLVRGRLVPLLAARRTARRSACPAGTTASMPPARPRRPRPSAAIGRRLGGDWRAFARLPQRLEWLAVIEGRRFYNDSAATTPESTIAALESLELPVWLLAGGKSKGSDFGPLAAEIARRARGAALFGSAGGVLRDQIHGQAPQFPCVAVETMDEALDWCWRRSRPAEADRVVAGVREHRPVPQFPPARRAILWNLSVGWPIRSTVRLAGQVGADSCIAAPGNAAGRDGSSTAIPTFRLLTRNGSML